MEPIQREPGKERIPSKEIIPQLSDTALLAVSVVNLLIVICRDSDTNGISRVPHSKHGAGLV